jgi:hypothetical protein
MQLYTEGMLTLQGSDYTAIMDVFQGNVDEINFAEIDDEEFVLELQTSNDVQVPPVYCPLTQSDFSRLQQTILILLAVAITTVYQFIWTPNYLWKIA